MRTLHDPLRKLVAQKISETSQKVAGDPSLSLSLETSYDNLVDPPDTKLGDLAFGCFALAKTLKKSPAQISSEMKAQFALDDNIAKVESAGPYLNVTFSSLAFERYLLNEIRETRFFHRQLTEQSPKTMIEYSQPNTHKELHVGHMRNMCLGDALVRVLKYSGTTVISSTFPGDVGTHVAKCLWYLKFHNQEPEPATGKGEWLGRMYSLANNKLEDEKGSELEAKNREHLTAILKQLEHQSGEYFDLWKKTRAWSLELMNKVYAWAEIQFDQWYWESDVDSSSVKYVQDLKAQGKLQESQGAVGMNLEVDNLGFCLLLKSDGTGLYATKDLELARRKFQDFKIEKSIYVVDMRQALHFKQVFKTLEHLGFAQAQNCFHLQYNFVELPDGAMSSRKGNIVPITALIRNMEDMVKEQYLKRYENEWPQGEIDLVAMQVAKGAIKFGMLRIDNNKKIVFDMKEWLKLDGESGPFIQYSCARIHSLCQKLGYSESAKIDFTQLIHPAEHALSQHLMNFNSVVAKAADDYRPSIICTYLYELAKKFNYFYHECSIAHAETPELRAARLGLAACAGQVLKTGLEVLGIPAPQRM